MVTDKVTGIAGRDLELESGSDRIRLLDALFFSEDAAGTDDMQFPLDRVKVGANVKPDFDETNLGLLFPQNDATEKAMLIGQMSHDWLEGDELHPHIHWQQAANTPVVWKLDYQWYNPGEAIPNWVTLVSNGTAFPWAGSKLAQISTFPPIDGTGKKISSLLKIRLYRDDNTTTGDVLADQFDCHFRRGSIGSRQEWIK